MPLRLLVRKDAVGSSTDVPKVPLVIRLSAGLANQASSDHGRLVCAHITASAAKTSKMGRITLIGKHYYRLRGRLHRGVRPLDSPGSVWNIPYFRAVFARVAANPVALDSR